VLNLVDGDAVSSANRAGTRAVTGRPVLEIGGTHARACRMDTTTWQPVPGSVHRLPLDSSGSAGAIISTLIACADALCLTPAEALAVAIPGPFDYQTGIARFEGVGKFDRLAGVDMSRTLLDGLAHPPRRLTFVNDADAFGLGEWFAGSARGHQRAVAITLGTGIGSAFVESGRIVSRGPSVPPDGDVYRLAVRGRPLEETVSRRAIIAAYRRRVPSPLAAAQDVRDIAAAALRGDQGAADVFAHAFRLLGEAVAPWLLRFRAQVLVVGGGLSASWALIETPMRTGLGAAADQVILVKSADTENAIAVGAAWHSQPAAAIGLP
jgi:glucokinase